MGKSQSKHDEPRDDKALDVKDMPKEKDVTEAEDLEEIKRVLEEKGVGGAQDMIKTKLEGWKDVNIKIGVTGDSGVGKSSFINAIRGLEDDDEDAAKPGKIETTLEPAFYPYDADSKITLVDLPGIGTTAFPDLVTYCEKTDLEAYDTFLILTAARFTQYDLQLAQKINDMGKSFFLIRTKIDEDERSENRKRNPNVEVMVKQVRDSMYVKVKKFGIGEDKIFLISNHQKDRWDFSRLIKAILEQLPFHQREALTLSLRILSEDIIKRKVAALRGRLWPTSLVFFLGLSLDIATLPITAMLKIVSMFEIPKLQPEEDSNSPEEDSDSPEDMILVGLASTSIALAIIGKKAIFFRSQLGFPEENSEEFNKLKPEFQERMRKFYPKDDKSLWEKTIAIFRKPLSSFSLSKYKASSVTASNALHCLLNEMEALSLDILKDTVRENQDRASR